MRYCHGLLVSTMHPPADNPSRDPRIHHHALAARTVIVAPRRADRPSDLDAILPRDGGACPFCAGNEALAPPAVLEAPAANAAWAARIIPNRYPIVEPLDRGDVAATTTRPACGLHEVVIESPLHDRSLLAVDADGWCAVWRLVQQRLAMLEESPLAWATVFKNSGAGAGASLEHLHSQLIGLDFVPPVIAAELAAAATTADPFGDLIRQAEATGCLVASADDLVALVPPAPRQPFETWILPRRPAAHFHSSGTHHAAALARLTQDVIARLERAVPGADFNWWLHQAPFTRAGGAGEARWHWHLEILPRLAAFAGFELGTGCHVSTMAPHEAARLLA